MDEIDAMKTIASALTELAEDERQRVLRWTIAKFGTPTPVGGSTPPEQPPKTQTKLKVAEPAAKQKNSKKSKSIIAMDKSLNLAPSGQKSAIDFSKEKQPANVLHKCVVAVYYLRDIIGLEKISVSSVYTFFKSLGWLIPSDMRNTLQQAGSKGWLDTADSEEIKLTSMGENIVEHSLPPKKVK